MTNVVQFSKAQGFTRMDNDLYEALIGADLSGREMRVALAIHRLTAGFNVSEARVYAGAVSKLSGIARENVSRLITGLLRQQVIHRHGGSKDPIGFNHPNMWRIDAKNEDKKGTSKKTQSVKSDTSLVSLSTHYKDINTKPSTNVLVAADAATTEVDQAEAPEATPKRADKIPYQQIADLYNRVCRGVFKGCVKLDSKRKRNISKCWHMEIDGDRPFRSLEMWEGYFNDCLANSHWRGENDRGWKADLEFVTRETSVTRVLEDE